MRLACDLNLPYSRALCSFDSEHRDHPKQRCAVGRTAVGLGKFSWLFQLHQFNIEVIPFEHRDLYLPLYEGAKAFEELGRKTGWELRGPIYADGPYPAFVSGVTEYKGGPSIADTNKQAEAILAGMNYMQDMVRYRLIGDFLPTTSASEDAFHYPALAGIT